MPSRWKIRHGNSRDKSEGNLNGRTCFPCGYDTFLVVGGGMANFTTYASWPVSNAAAVRIMGLRASFRELWSYVIERTSLLNPKINPLATRFVT